MAVIPFYGAVDRELFAIERKAMDRPGRVIAELDQQLPTSGIVLDIGAGDGFTADRLTAQDRSVVAIEPATGMIRRDRKIPWVQADAEHLPFATGAAAAAYATWAYFFSRDWDPLPGLAELHRVVVPGGPLLIADNLGGDDFTALSEANISADQVFWETQGFQCVEVNTSFGFENLGEAQRLLGFYFGEGGRERAKLELSFRVGLFIGSSDGPG